MIFLKPKFWDKKKFPSLISLLLLPISLIVVIKNYYENSKLEYVGKFEYGEKVGKWKYYHSNGVLFKEQNFKDGIQGEDFKSFD